jgi:tetratricopeptide (TPR) repeat protein
MAATTARTGTVTADWPSKDIERLPERTPKAIKSAKIFNFVAEIARRHAAENKDQIEPIAEFTKIIEANPNDVLAWFARARCYQEVGQHDLAIDDYSRAIELDQTYPEAYNNCGAVYAEVGDYKTAIDYYDRAIVLDYQYAEPYNNRGVIYADQGDHKTAIANFDQAINLDPRFAVAYSNRGTSYAKQGDYKNAIANFDQAINLDPHFAIAYSNRGTSYAEQGDYKAALANFDQAINLNPSYSNAYFGRGSTYRALNQHETAIADYDRAIKADPKNGDAYYNRGYSRGALGDFKEAISDILQSVRIDPALKPLAATALGPALHFYYTYEINTRNTSGKNIDLQIGMPELTKSLERAATALLDASEPKPFAILSERQVAAMIKHAKKHPWDERQKRGWAYHTNAFIYLQIVYARWIPGLTREMLAEADESLHKHLTRKISIEGLPEFLDVPTGAEARLRNISDASERSELEVARKVQRHRQRRHVARKATLGG